MSAPIDWAWKAPRADDWRNKVFHDRINTFVRTNKELLAEELHKHLPAAAEFRAEGMDRLIVFQIQRTADGIQVDPYLEIPIP